MECRDETFSQYDWMRLAPDNDCYSTDLSSHRESVSRGSWRDWMEECWLVQSIQTVRLSKFGATNCRDRLAANSSLLPSGYICGLRQHPHARLPSPTRRLRAEGYTGPIVALTANAMEGDDCRCRAAGCNDYLTKPIDHARFLGTIERWTRPSPAAIPPITPIPTTTDLHSCSQP